MGKTPRRKQRRLARKLREIRRMLKLSQSEIVERMGLQGELPRGSVSNFEKSRRVPSLFVLLRYARLAGLCLEIIVDDELDLPRELIPGSAHDHSGKSTRRKRPTRE
jgi:transcriptional regulator with XRE-family HTH domain